MYDKIIQEFQNGLVDRKLNKRIMITLSIASLLCVICQISLQVIFRETWWIAILTPVLCVIIMIFIILLIVHITLKKYLLLCRKDFFHPINCIRFLTSLQQSDVKLLLPILKTAGINTRPKVQELMQHFRMHLIVKRTDKIAISAVLSIVLSVVGIIVTNVIIKNNNFWLLCLLLSMIIFETVAITIFIKILYKSLYHDFSYYSTVERIEVALSEIWIRKLLKS